LITGGGEQARAVELEESIITIGSEATIQLPDPTIAKLALTLRKDPSGAYIAEPGDGWVQRNRGRLTEPVRLAANDVLRLGPFRLVVQQYRLVRAPAKMTMGGPIAGAPGAAPGQLVANARARIAWGDDPAVVKQELVTAGLTTEQAAAIVNRMDRAERTWTRVRALGQIIVGGAAAAVAAWMMIDSPKASGGMLAIGIFGLVALVHGIFRLVFGDR